MSFEIKLYDGIFYDESEASSFDFQAILYEDKFDCDYELVDRSEIATASGFIVNGEAEWIHYVSDIDADTFVEGYVEFFKYLNTQIEIDFVTNSFKVLIIKRLDAVNPGNSDGTKLLEIIKKYSYASGIDHIVLMRDLNSKTNLEKYYRKVGFHKLPLNNWIYDVQDSGVAIIAEDFYEMFSEVHS